MKPVVFGIAAETLNDEERALFRDCDPAGYILFARNIADRDQLRALTDDLREVSGRGNVPILIDQEGGRVTRMKPPAWPEFPPWAKFDALYDIAPISAIEAARSNAHAIGLTLAECGINVDCLPLLDVRQPGAHDVIGDRALGFEPLRVAALGRAVLNGLGDAGVAGVVKHIPGHGRALVDTHKALPRVTASAEELATDIAPFKALANAPMAMTAHIVFEAWDGDRCATLSPTIINTIIRGEIGFDGLLFSDDLDMQALDGDPARRAAAVVEAGCDIALNCWARMDEMKATVALLDDISAASRARLDRAMESIGPARTADALDALLDKRDSLLALA
ncbi:beta-N-acetylhexosaminidase [Parasphingopyxis lamellibrachiae]|uniref:beta-N-acetylhexosaminidase n=1 Tax=Parasphingopyxis lamellibrachiae TaxID=680125 RepID=A0A3D9FFU2_9SPHN|nr:beta-N-acetylhexosaminidase [Parasphingopyxis lamellibrachiae]RED16402.1 beta-N-acetylhexosaminidase [Parasphingopyxis lamellibrachiae]